MTPSQNAAFSHLVDGLWAGTVGERQFVHEALLLGASLTAIIQILNEVREEDGTWPISA